MMKPLNFAWYDLMTSDTKAAAAFYKSVIGWDAKDASVGDNSYAIFSMGAANVGGLMPIPDSARANGAPPCWTGYILVDDVDAYAARVSDAGGKILRGPVDIPGVLRLAVVADPQGAVFMLFKGMSGTPPAELAPGAPGSIGWRELHAGDGAGAFAFYAKIFGWTKTAAFDMGALGIYQTFAAGGEAVGGMMTKAADAPTPFWLYYINVDGIEAAAARTTKAGGKICMDPHQVPTGQWIVLCTDPQGAWFAMLSTTR
ncbi:MAG TPA: VOC family protein [Usitatibacteraceae bacterium]